jgi:hypothetical protein
MERNRKPRADSKLKKLAASRQAEIAGYARTQGLVKTVAWLRDSGLKTSIAALSRFLAWHREQLLSFAKNEKGVASIIALVKRAPELRSDRNP